MQRIKNETLPQELTCEKDTDYSFWKITKRTKRLKIQNSPLRKTNGLWATNNQEYVDIFADCVENTFQSHDMQHEEEFSERIVKGWW